MEAKKTEGLHEFDGRKDYENKDQASFWKPQRALTFECASLQCCGPHAGKRYYSTSTNTHVPPATPISGMN